MNPMRILITYADRSTKEVEASCWTDFFEKARVIDLARIVKLERIDLP